MAEDRRWKAVATIEVNGLVAGPYVMPDSTVTIGRSYRAGLRSPSPRLEVPRELARLRPTKSGWVLENEGATATRHIRPAVRVTGPSIRSKNGAVFMPYSWVLLDEGEWTLRWDAGVGVAVDLRPYAPADAMLKVAQDEPLRPSGSFTIPAEPVRLTALERRNMAALFAYLLRGEPQPGEPYKRAAEELGGDTAARQKNRDLVKAQLPKITSRVNRLRGSQDPLLAADEVGWYLVHVTGTLSQEDLED